MISKQEQSKIWRTGIAVFLISLFCATHAATATELSLEGELQTDLVQFQGLIKNMGRKLDGGEAVQGEMERLKKSAESIRINHLLLQERFRRPVNQAAVRGTKAHARHGAMWERYREAIDQLLNLLDRLAADTGHREMIEELDRFLDKHLHKKKNPILAALPYKNVKYPATRPKSAPSIIPVYRGGNQTVTLSDLDATRETAISLEIATLAQSLDWNPVLIYEWVKNNIETEWYWGCMKGAKETLRQGSGNDCDQAALLITLLRASGFPSRYVRGVIEFHRGLESVVNLTGIADPWKIAQFFQKAGIPHDLVIAGGGITNFQIEHIWVESEIPYANYRGAVIGEEGRAWIALDTSLKVAGYDYNEPVEMTQAISLDALRADYLGAVQTLTPLEYLRSAIETHLARSAPDKSYDDYLRDRTLIPEVLHILPASPQFDEVRVTHEYGAIPHELLHHVRFKATGAGDAVLFDITLPAYALSNQQIVITYEPESIEDQEIINGYGGLGNVPAYLVRLRPVLRVNNDRMIVGQHGLPMGADFSLTLELIGPQGTDRVENREIAGKLGVIGIVAQQAVFPADVAGEEKGSERLLFEAALRYTDRWNRAEHELGSLLDVAVLRPLPTVVTLGSIMDVSYLLDTPHDLQWRGVYVDADLRAVDAVSCGENGDGREKTFLKLSSLEGSVLEHVILEEQIPVESLSTAKLIGLANSQGIPLVQIDENNVSTRLPTLNFDENVLADIANAAAQGLTVTIPETVIRHEDWTGIGYVTENEETGEAGWMLSGMV
ncbi:MAG: transglutaminase-like domain-containing protein, partial [bacterium]|nr:transglutaminase-like domain-containing protein [bacterium]